MSEDSEFKSNAGRPKGHPKTGGRPKGGKNLKTLAREAGLKPLARELERHNFDITTELIELYREDAATVQERTKILEMILDRISPKLAPLKIQQEKPKDEVLEAVTKASDEDLLKALT